MGKLTIRQEQFCIEYAASANAKQAYKKAGYKAGTDNAATVNAFRLLQKPEIQERLRELAAEINTPRIANAQEIQEFLTSVMRGEKTEEEIVVFQDYAETREKRPPIAASIRAAEALAKMQGIATNINITGAVPVKIVDDLGE